MNPMQRFLSAILLVLFCAQSPAAVQAYINETTVYKNNPVTLTIEVDGHPSASPDLSVLKESFRILSTSTGSSVQIINGATSSSKRWVVQLQPLKKGQLEIPPIAVGTEKSEPITLTVTDTPPDVKPKSRDPALLEASTGSASKAIYVQQQIPYTLKLLTDDSVVSGELHPPEIEGAVIEQLSKDKQYRITRDGKVYNVLERQYVISPERSGTLTIPPARFTGTQKAPRQPRQSNFSARDGFLNDTFGNDFFSGTPFGAPRKTIQTSSASISIEVQPVAAEFRGKHWLPAENLELTDSWAGNEPEFRVGEPAVRHLKLTAKGLSGTQIPEITWDNAAKIRLYPDRKTSETRTDGTTLFGISEQSITYIPNQVGKTTLPAITLDWWNTQTGKQETLTLAEKTIVILAGAAGIDITETQPETVTHPAGANDISTPEKETHTPLAYQDKTPWFIAAVLGFLLILSLLWIMLRKPVAAAAPAQRPRSKPVIGKKPIMQALRQACEQNNAPAAAEQLLLLARAQWPESPPHSLGTLAEKVSLGSQEIRQLDQQLYSATTNEWNGENLWAALRNGLQILKTIKSSHRGELGNLYPH